MNLNLILFILHVFISSTFIVGQIATPNYALEATAPRSVELSVVLDPQPYRRIRETYDATILIFEKSQRVPTISRQQNIQVTDNFFRTFLDISEDLLVFFDAGYVMHTQIIFEENLVVELPFASIPGVIKSAYALRSKRFMDERAFKVDYNQHRIGIGTSSPSATRSCWNCRPQSIYW